MALVYDPITGTYVDDGTADDDAVDVGGSGSASGGSGSGSTSTGGGILDAFKGIWERFKTGNSTPNDLQAGLALLNLLAPSLNAPKTAGWKGSIDMNKQFTRTPVVNPATDYKPYSGQPVMGQRYFNSFYGAPPAAAGGGGGGGGSGGDTLTTIGTDPNSPGDTGGRAAGGLLSLARGGEANAPRYLQGQTDGMADKIPSDIDGVQPAKLSHGEFVIPADVVSHLGNGNSDAGAKVLYKMMDRVRQARTGSKEQGKEINPEKFTPGGIAGYAGGGAVAFTTGGATGGAGGGAGGAGGAAGLGTSSEQNIAEWAGPYVGDMLSKTMALTNAPYQAYTGPLSAGYSPLQSKVFTGLQGLDFPGQLGKSFSATGAYQLPGEGAASGPTGIAAQYMNPYLSAVLTPQLEEMRRQGQITQMGNAAKLTQAGAFGGGRQAIMDAETQRNMAQEQNKAIGTAYANAYDRAMGQFNTEQGQAKTLADMMATAGGMQRDIEQQGITEARKQFEAEQMKPYTDLRFQREMLSGLPVATQSTTPNTSTMGQLTGGLSTLEKALKDLGIVTG